MNNKLEKQFFDTFGIEPMPYCCYHDCNCPINDVGKFNSKCPKQAVTKECDARIMQKPQITDSILLELILINMHNEDLFGYPTNIQELKDNTLKQLIETYNKFSTCVTCDSDYQQTAREIKHQVRTLFEEGN